MRKRIDYNAFVGQTFYPWLVLSLGGKARSGETYLNVRCLNCGLERRHTKGNLTSGYRCRWCSLLPKGESGLNRLYRVYKSQAIARGYAFNLTHEAFKSLTSSPCYYCGSPPSSVSIGNDHRGVLNRSAWGDYTYNGVDRRHNTEGYTPENSVSCCGLCNVAKAARPFEEFKARWLDIYHRLSGGVIPPNPPQLWLDSLKE